MSVHTCVLGTPGKLFLWLNSNSDSALPVEAKPSRQGYGKETSAGVGQVEFAGHCRLPEPPSNFKKQVKNNKVNRCISCLT